MNFNGKKALVSIALLATFGTYGCAKEVYPDKQYQGKMAEEAVKLWVEQTDSSMMIYRLIEKGNYEVAKALLERELKNQKIAAKGGLEILISVKPLKLSQESVDRIDKVLVNQIEKIDATLPAK